MISALRVAAWNPTLAPLALSGALLLAAPAWAGSPADAAGNTHAQVAETPQSASSCEEDRSTDGPPTISRPFDPKVTTDGGSAFATARTHALQYCAAQRCTLADRTVERTAHAYALAAMKRGKLIVGFRCEPPAESSVSLAATAPGAVEYTLQQPAEIDAALAKASAHCAPAKTRAELADLKEKDGTFLAVFNCGS